MKGWIGVIATWVTRPGGAREERFASLGVTWYGGALLP